MRGEAMPAGEAQGFSLTRANGPHSEERARILSIATRHVGASGLDVGFEQSALEEIVREAQVSTRVATKIWPQHDDFLYDLFTEIAQQTRRDLTDTETLVATWDFLSSRRNDLRTPEGRRSIMLDVVRTAAEQNLEEVTMSTAWRSYASLALTIRSRPESRGRTAVLEALRNSELAFIDTMEMFYRNIMATVGYRLKEEFQNDYHPFVIATAAVVEGLGISRTTVPEVVDSHLSRGGEGERNSWSLVSLAFVGVIEAFIEFDPDYEPEEAISRLSGGVDVTPSPAENPQGY
jgi:AcrR family transcriptional regulator